MRMRKSFLAVTVLLILMMVLAGCSSPEPTEEAEKIVIRQVGMDDQEITVEQLKEYEAVEEDVESVNSSGEVTPYSVKGALLSDVLADMEIVQGELDAIRLIAGDGYSIEVNNEVLMSRDIILAYEIDGEPLLEDTRPIRIIIPEERAMYWVRNLVTIEIVQLEASVPVTEVTIIETAVQGLAENDYLLDGETQKGVKTTDLAVWDGDTDPRVHLLSVDDLEKFETWENFSKGLILWTGSEAPAFVSEDLPLGMHVKEIYWFTVEHQGYLSAVRADEKLDEKMVGEQSGVSLQEALSAMGFRDNAGIRLVAADGYSVEIAAGDIEKGILYVDDEGRACTAFSDLAKNTSVKDLMKIEVVE